MAKMEVMRENYIAVQGWMIKDLHLKGNELIIYACIYGFSQTENQVFGGSLQYLADWTNTTKRSVMNCLKSLTEKGLIVKDKRIIDGVKTCEYHAKKFTEVVKNFPYPMEKSSMGVVKNFHHPMEKSSMGGGENFSPNNIDYYNIYILNNIKNIVDYLNKKLGSKYSYKSKKTQDCIKARFNEIDGLTVEDFYTVIDKQYQKWSGTEMAQYLRPETLFGNKFESYLNAPMNRKKSQSKSYDTDEFFEAAIERAYEEMGKESHAEDPQKENHKEVAKYEHE